MTTSAQQAGYQLATYNSEDGGSYFDENLFWNIQALMYMGAFSAREIGILDAQAIRFKEPDEDNPGCAFDPPAEDNGFIGTIWWSASEEEFAPALLAHEFGHALAYYTGDPNWDEEACAYRRENAVRWWYYINQQGAPFPLDDHVTLPKAYMYAPTDVQWAKYLEMGGFNWAVIPH